jgi:hypothetical protein
MGRNACSNVQQGSGGSCMARGPAGARGLAQPMGFEGDWGRVRGEGRARGAIATHGAKSGRTRAVNLKQPQWQGPPKRAPMRAAGVLGALRLARRHGAVALGA